MWPKCKREEYSFDYVKDDPDFLYDYEIIKFVEDAWEDYEDVNRHPNRFTTALYSNYCSMMEEVIFTCKEVLEVEDDNEFYSFYLEKAQFLFDWFKNRFESENAEFDRIVREGIIAKVKREQEENK